VADEVDHVEGALADGHGVAVTHAALDLDPGLLGDRPGVVGAGDGGRAGGGHDVGEGAVVVPVLVRRDHGRETAVPDHREQPGRVGGGVDQELLVGRTAAQHVAVVGHLVVDGDLGDHQLRELPDIGGAAWLDLACVRRHAAILRCAPEPPHVAA
jgi:hypothetical protein